MFINAAKTVKKTFLKKGQKTTEKIFNSYVNHNRNEKLYFLTIKLYIYNNM